MKVVKLGAQYPRPIWILPALRLNEVWSQPYARGLRY